jgi:hypothetical protein
MASSEDCVTSPWRNRKRDERELLLNGDIIIDL